MSTPLCETTFLMRNQLLQTNKTTNASLELVVQLCKAKIENSLHFYLTNFPHNGFFILGGQYRSR